MPPLRCIIAEWQLVRTRLIRSRLGLWLLLLGAAAVAGNAGTASSDLVGIALQVGILGAVLGIAFGAGSDADCAALALTLTHPTTPLAAGLGRWFGALTAAGGTMLTALALAASARGEPGLGLVHSAIAGLAAAAATAAVTLAGVWLGGNAVAVVIFLYVGLASELSPGGVEGLIPPGLGRALGIAIVRTAPGLWRYRGLVLGDGAAWVHAVLSWLAGMVISTWTLRRRRA